MVKAEAIASKTVVLGVSGDVEERELPEEDLRRISCHGILEKPWNLRMEEMVAELMGEKDNRWHGTVRHAPKKLTSMEWRKVYGFLRQRERMALQMDQFIDGKFSTHVNPKDGYVVSEYKDVRDR